jgi:hypothetical protein
MPPVNIEVLLAHTDAVREGKATPQQLRELRENLREFKTPEDKTRLAEAFHMRFEAAQEKFIMDTVEKNLTNLELRQLRLEAPGTPVAKGVAGVIAPVEKFIGGELSKTVDTTGRILGGAESHGGFALRAGGIILGLTGLTWLSGKIVRSVTGAPQSRFAKVVQFLGLSTLALWIYNRYGEGAVAAVQGLGNVPAAYMQRFEKKPEEKKIEEKQPDEKKQPPSPLLPKPEPVAKVEGGGEKK